jgi:hypothetical protein
MLHGNLCCGMTSTTNYELRGAILWIMSVLVSVFMHRISSVQ